MPDSWWTEYLKANKEARCYKFAPPLLEDEQILLFNDVLVTGEDVLYPTSGQLSSSSSQDDGDQAQGEDEFSQTPSQMESTPRDSQGETQGDTPRCTSREPSSESSKRAAVRKAVVGTKKRPRHKKDDGIAAALEKVAEALGPAREKQLADHEQEEMKQCMAILDRCNDEMNIGGTLYVHAIAMFASDTKRHLWLTAKDDATRASYLSYDYQRDCLKLNMARN